MASLEPELARLQRECKAQKLPVMIVFEGFGAAGKGYQIGKLIHAMDPRGFYVRSVGRESEEQRRHPFLWQLLDQYSGKRGDSHSLTASWYRKVRWTASMNCCRVATSLPVLTKSTALNGNLPLMEPSSSNYFSVLIKKNRRNGLKNCRNPTLPYGG